MKNVFVIYGSLYCILLSRAITIAFQVSQQQQPQQHSKKMMNYVSSIGSPCRCSSSSSRTVTTTTIRSLEIIVLYQTGGWGIGPQREMLPEEFARRSDNKRIFDGYQLRERGEFMRQVQRDKDSMVSDELNELLGVAKIAGINVKDPTERLNKFENDIINDININDDDDDLDLSIRWDDDLDIIDDTITTVTTTNDVVVDDITYTSRRRKRKITTSTIDDSITRFDEDTGASGVW